MLVARCQYEGEIYRKKLSEQVFLIVESLSIARDRLAYILVRLKRFSSEGEVRDYA
jgi:hypothetical protein